MTSLAPTRSLERYTVVWAAAGALAAAVAAWLALGAVDPAITHTFWLLAGATAITELIELDLPFSRHTGNAFTLTEAAVVASLLLLSAPEAVLATALGVAAAEVLRRPDPPKLAYNIGHRTVAVAAAAATVAALPTIGPTITGTAALSVAAGMAAYTTIDLLGLIGLLQRLTDQPPRHTLHHYGWRTIAAITATTTLGVTLTAL